ncbi:MAG: hypothetical protein GY851_03280 [bacterium]|nr:hypothetical protein [bacterium]
MNQPDSSNRQHTAANPTESATTGNHPPLCLLFAPPLFFGICSLVVLTVLATAAEPAPVPYIILDERELSVRTQAASMVADVENAKGRAIERRRLTGWVALPREQYDALMKGAE